MFSALTTPHQICAIGSLARSIPEDLPVKLLWSDEFYAGFSWRDSECITKQFSSNFKALVVQVKEVSIAQP
ncbi:hypothetical protein Tco_1519850, partial [Tanacetum coccineum]